MYFMPHAFSQNEHPFGWCGHFSQVEPFEKPWFLIMQKKSHKTRGEAHKMSKLL